MRIRCDCCHHVIDIDDAYISNYQRSKGGKSTSPALTAARHINIAKARTARLANIAARKAKEAEERAAAIERGECPPDVDKPDSGPVAREPRGRCRNKVGQVKSPESESGAKQSPKKSQYKPYSPTNAALQALDSVLASSTEPSKPRKPRLRETEGRSLCKQCGLTSYHASALQLIWEHSRKYCRGTAPKSLALHLGRMQWQMTHNGPHHAWRIVLGTVELPPADVLPRMPWITDKAVWLEQYKGNRVGYRVLVYCCEMQ